MEEELAGSYGRKRVTESNLAHRSLHASRLVLSVLTSTRTLDEFPRGRLVKLSSAKLSRTFHKEPSYIHQLWRSAGYQIKQLTMF